MRECYSEGMSPERPRRLQDMQSLPGNRWSHPARVVLTIVQSGDYRIIRDGADEVLQVEQTAPSEQPTESFPVVTQQMLDEQG